MIVWRVVLGLVALAANGPAALARDASARPAGPCSPISGPDGDIPSEMPGCLHRHRPPEGSLADEMAFRRGRARGSDPLPPEAAE